MAKKKSTIKLLSSKELSKKYRFSHLASTADPGDLWLPSRIIPLNYALGGGIKYGRMIEVAGYESTGKSLVALDFAAATQSLGGIVLWADVENVFSAKWASQLGVDPEKVHLLYNENRVEVIADWMLDHIRYYRSIFTNNEPILMVIDSLAAMEAMSKSDEYQTDASAQMGNRAKAVEEMWRKRNILLNTYGVCCISVNQLRKKIGAKPWEDDDKTTAGSATAFYASGRVFLYAGKRIRGILKDGKFKEEASSLAQPFGHIVRIKVKKNKLAAPVGNIETRVLFKPQVTGYVGYDKYAGLYQILRDCLVLKRPSSKSPIFFKKEPIARSEESFMEKFMTDEVLRKRVLKASGINTISSTREKLASIQTNLYPVTEQTLKKDSGDTEDEG